MFDDEMEDEIDVKELPIYKKGKEIYEVVLRIAELVPKDHDHLQEIMSWMVVDAGNLSVKIAGSYNIELYDLKMEAASIIRKSARELITNTHSLEAFGFNDTEYFVIIRTLVEEYRLLFIDWVSTFNPWDYIIDRWGLFNPPGVGPFDHDPDDDIPFTNFDE